MKRSRWRETSIWHGWPSELQMRGFATPNHDARSHGRASTSFPKAMPPANLSLKDEGRELLNPMMTRLQTEMEK